MYFKVVRILLAGGLAAILPGVALIINSLAELKKHGSTEKDVLQKTWHKGRNYSFWCDPHHSIDSKILPTTIMTINNEDIPLFTWEDRSFGDKWTPLERCQVVSRRLQVFTDRHGDFFKYIAVGTLNKYPVLCIAKSEDAGSSCNEYNLLITLIPGESEAKILEEIIAFPTETVRVKRGSLGKSEIIFDVQQYVQEAPRSPRKKRVIEN